MASQAKSGQSSPSFDGRKVFPTPSFADKIVVEVVSHKLENYAAVPYGTAHPETTLFPDHRLVLQVEKDEENAVRYYAADRATQQTFSANISYSGDDTACPIFTRDHLVRRSAYTPTTKLTPLSGLIDADVTAGGTGYEPSGTTPPVNPTTASLAGGTGSGGAVSVIVSPAGVVIGLYITAIGNYTVAPNVTISGAGAGATGTVSIQIQQAVLVKEDVSAKTGDERVDGLYVLVRYIYERLAGPDVPYRRIDPILGEIWGFTNVVANTGQHASVSTTDEVSYSARDGSSIVLIKKTEQYGAGVSGGSGFPTLTGESRGAEVRGETIITESLVVPAGTDPDIDDGGDFIIDSTVTPKNSALSVKTTKRMASLPPDEIWYEWRAVSLPLLIFDILPVVYCNDTSFARVVTEWTTSGGTTNIRKHRITVSYHDTAPELPMGVNVIEKTNIQVSGVFLNFSKGDVLIDALLFEGDFALSDEMDACAWLEGWDYTETEPSATEFEAGEWYLAPNGFQVQQFGQSMFKATLIEYWSAAGEPPP